jgi:DNA-binding MarR family transcriptional regulator
MPRAARKDGLYEPNLFLQFFLTGQPIGRLIERAIAPSGMRSTEYALLSAVDELEPVMPSDVARLTGMPRPTLTPYIERLVTAGYVGRVPNPRDGRSYMLTLTPEGRRVKDESGRALGVALQSLVAQLEGDADEMTSVLGRLREAAEETLLGFDSEGTCG